MTEEALPGRDAAGRTFSIRRDDSAGDVVLALSGDFDLTGMDRFEQATADILAGASITVDLSDLGFLDSSGLRALMNLDARNGAGARIALRAPQPHVLRLLEMCSFGERFEIVS